MTLKDGEYMMTIGMDCEYNYCDPFLVTIVDEELQAKVYRVKVLSQKRELKKICENRNIRKVYHHASGDIFILRNIGIRVVPPYECTLIAANLVDENYSSRNLKKLVIAHLGIETHESNLLKSVIKKYKKIAQKEGFRESCGRSRLFWRKGLHDGRAPVDSPDPGAQRHLGRLHRRRRENGYSLQGMREIFYSPGTQPGSA